MRSALNSFISYCLLTTKKLKIMGVHGCSHTKPKAYMLLLKGIHDSVYIQHQLIDFGIARTENRSDPRITEIKKKLFDVILRAIARHVSLREFSVLPVDNGFFTVQQNTFLEKFMKMLNSWSTSVKVVLCSGIQSECRVGIKSPLMKLNRDLIRAICKCLS